eukprot:scaffold20263_cov140-Skeletonema_menzelii.AAC.1
MQDATCNPDAPPTQPNIFSIGERVKRRHPESTKKNVLKNSNELFAIYKLLSTLDIREDRHSQHDVQLFYVQGVSHLIPTLLSRPERNGQLATSSRRYIRLGPMMWCWRHSQIRPHQVTYVGVAPQIRMVFVWALDISFLTIQSENDGPLQKTNQHVTGVTFEYVERCGAGGTPKSGLIRTAM